MAATPSVMIPLGTHAPAFSLPDTLSGKTLTLKDCAGPKATVIIFMCNHCPYVKLLNTEIVNIANQYLSQGVKFTGISSNDAIQYPDDGPDKMTLNALQHQYPFPYLYDESQEVAKAYEAACTPDFFVFDKNLKLVYRGQFDDARPGNQQAVTGKDLRDALNAIVSDKEVSPEQIPSIGCNIKWKK